jgi:molybdenum cofactor cytidylyltransferase
LRKLVDAYADGAGFSILIPLYRGLRGNPVLFAARHIPDVIEGGLNLGCRRLIETHEREVGRIEFDEDVFVFDCDTPEDYRRLLGRMEGAV